MNLLVLQHVAVEHPGIFRDFFREDGFQWKAVELDEGEPVPVDLEPFDLMLVFGGPQDVWQEEQYPWLRAEKAAIAKFVIEMHKPFLGVCLGHQLLADAIGGKVGRAATPEVGVMTATQTKSGRSDALLAGLPNPLTMLQWHGAEVLDLPVDAEILASSAACGVQAFRYRDRAYGIQGHIEVTDNTVAEWAAIPAYATALKLAMGAKATNRLTAEVAQRLPDFHQSARRIYENLKAIVHSARA